ncbi:putative transcriptional regulator, ArsR family protein [Alkalihalophilus pseudofirmus OF4]|uniref:Transcriptional regulator, ArsR family protein n=1 Tax=Alkalihalophilus pseudofirmus (strain ATCC BAA-2126 / JCM 17055 / OF4) TaxID=398511 RepID=D3FV81_ALKPO|nr:winged helix-turn-helix domain-containing protein [Alkalihalophilus pseudofirmus]ADC50282.1 putative transcriptional regulator, ArsR family protein [Alkalihalophilus pseudofirmus OF4]
MEPLKKMTFVSSPVIDLLTSMLRVVNHEQLKETEGLGGQVTKEIETWALETRKKVPEEMMKELETFFHHESYLAITLIPLIIKYELYSDVHSFLSALHNLEDEELYYYFINTGFGPDEELTTFSDPSAVISFLNKLNVPETEKWKLSYLIFDGPKTKQRLIKLIERFYYHYYESVEAQVIKDQQKWIDTMTDFTNERTTNYFNTLNKQFVINVEEWEKVIVTPSYFMDFSMLFMSIRKINLTAYVPGIRHIEVQDVGRGEKETLESIRTMTDEKRFKMLQLLNKQPMYGYELAQHLDVSNSTISHHLSALVARQFVQATRRENKVYYEVNQEEIKQVIRSLERLLIK